MRYTLRLAIGIDADNLKDAEFVSSKIIEKLNNVEQKVLIKENI